jgi:beta-N-acetylhexosaminidase
MKKENAVVNLSAKPFYLTQQDMDWVEQTITTMTLEEKIGQLFINLGRSREPGYMKTLLDRFHIGGARYIPASAAEIHKQNTFYQQHTKIPLLISSNCEAGGNGACNDGTYIATSAQCGASADPQTAYQVGYVSGVEGTAVGCNWTFGPIVDILLNWRNTIVNTRAYGNDPDQVIAMAKAYIKGVRESGMAACAKHFPGDGVEERDQHLVLGVNDLSCEEWDRTFGKVYRALIEDGLQSIMVGHIALPAYSRKLRPGIRDQEIMPATLAPELISDLLRGQLGFNGLILTDASHMAGMACAKERRLQVPEAIAAGCDMFLFFNDPEEDFGYMLEGFRSGIISEQRLDDALHRILGFKAMLKLHEKQVAGTLVPGADPLAQIGCEQHLSMAQQAAEKSVTLVKDTQHNLPITPRTHPRIKLYYLAAPPQTLDQWPDPVRAVVIEELERAGFQVDLNPNFYDLAKDPAGPQNLWKAMQAGKMEDFRSKYDAVFVFANIRGYAQENVVRVKWASAHSNEIPWYVAERPTVFVSLNYTTHLIDVPMVKTYINAYGDTRILIRETIRRIVGEAEFTGKYNETVFCDKWDTRL